ncbi:TPA: hypothetical protein GRI81_09690 [Vibrio parahaemolyticus]|nr:hypothetical protein [Vibrio parahaemolyticus]
MAKPVLVVVHGIGEHTAKSIAETVNLAATNALKRYEFWGDEDFKAHVEVVGVGYNDVFKDALDRIKNQSSTIAEYIKGMGFAETIIEALNNVEDGKFLHTHVFDVLFYAGLHSGLVRAVVAEEISKALGGDEAGEIHILAHSMGTAVVHDVLCHKYPYHLNPFLNKIESLWMVANTSQLLHDWNPIQNNANPQTSIVNPSTSSSGCVKKYFNVNHKLDFVSQPCPFIVPSSWVRYKKGVPKIAYYRNIETSDFNVNKSPHDLRQYLEDPLVSEPFLSELMPKNVFNASREEHDAANEKGKGVIAQSQDVITFAEDSIDNIDDIKEFLQMLVALKERFEDIWDEAKVDDANPEGGDNENNY